MLLTIFAVPRRKEYHCYSHFAVSIGSSLTHVFRPIYMFKKISIQRANCVDGLYLVYVLIVILYSVRSWFAIFDGASWTSGGDWSSSKIRKFKIVMLPCAKGSTVKETISKTDTHIVWDDRWSLKVHTFGDTSLRSETWDVGGESQTLDGTRHINSWIRTARNCGGLRWKAVST